MRGELQDFMAHINGNIQGFSTKITNMDLNLNTINERVERCISSTAETADRVTSLELKFQELSTVNNVANFPIDSCLSEVEDRLLRHSRFIPEIEKTIATTSNYSPNLTCSRPHKTTTKQLSTNKKGIPNPSSEWRNKHIS
ncbi:uncharacterized protein LOC122504521 [Leptopilina heterotoma]|uniref:uncharacterized protein LOC122504521 n=1 Tax=Leptopilina heterotoma TaxID=63436 RepID=UPI001CA8975A|nr:uncharacterized protein LOC122504521 [Leptopilina heterotoma]